MIVTWYVLVEKLEHLCKNSENPG